MQHLLFLVSGAHLQSICIAVRPCIWQPRIWIFTPLRCRVMDWVCFDPGNSLKSDLRQLQRPLRGILHTCLKQYALIQCPHLCPYCNSRRQNQVRRAWWTKYTTRTACLTQEQYGSELLAACWGECFDKGRERMDLPPDIPDEASDLHPRAARYLRGDWQH